MKVLKKSLCVVLALTMMLYGVACSDNKQSTAQSTASATSTAQSTTSTEQDTASTSQSTEQDSQSNIETEFSMDKFVLANSTDKVVEPGSGKAVMVSVSNYNLGASEDGETEYEITSADDSFIYRWVDEDGTVKWYRENSASIAKAYAEISPDGVGVRFEMDADGNKTQTVYTDGFPVSFVYKRLNILNNADVISGPIKIDAEAAKDTNFADALDGATYKVPVQQGENIYNVYMDGDMKVIAAFIEDSFGCKQSNIVSIVDEPNVVDFLAEFGEFDSVDCNITLNGTDLPVKLYNNIDTMITNYTTEAKITAGAEVKLKSGELSLEIKDSELFKLDGANNFTVVTEE